MAHPDSQANHSSFFVETEGFGPILTTPIHSDSIRPGIRGNVLLLGGKGEGLVDMVNVGLPVPPGFILTTETYKKFKPPTRRARRQKLYGLLVTEVERLERYTSLELGNKERPLFVSVRSGAPISMPGQMETILNIGLNDDTLPALAAEIGMGPALEAYFELISGFASTFNFDPEKFEQIRNRYILDSSIPVNSLPIGDLKSMLLEAKELFKQQAGKDFPQEVGAQVLSAVEGVFASWNKTRRYRREHYVPESMGTAAVVQKMVFGNSEKEGAATGVAFTRNHQTYDPQPLVTVKMHAQGTSVVGEETNKHQPLSELPDNLRNQLQTIIDKVNTDDRYKRHAQELEFTFDGETVWVLQRRRTQMLPLAQFRFALNAFREGVLTEDEAKYGVLTTQLRQVVQPGLAAEAVDLAKSEGRLIGEGKCISLGHATAPLATSFEEARKYGDRPVILVIGAQREDFIKVPDNIIGIANTTGGIGSHSARLAEKIGAVKGIPITFGTSLDKNRLQSLNGRVVTLDGTNGNLFEGEIAEDTINRLISNEELEIASRWLADKMANPWKYFNGLELPNVPNTRHKERDPVFARCRDLIAEARQQFRSLKAQETFMAQSLFSPDTRQGNSILKPDDKEGIKKEFQRVLAAGYDSSVRTAFHPHLPASAPWARVSKIDDIDQLFDDPNYSKKYGGWDKIVAPREGAEVAEVIIEETPVGKMDPEYEREHAAWTLSCTKAGEVVFQLRPFSAHLRALEDANPDDLISYTFSSKTGDDPMPSHVGFSMGKNLIAQYGDSPDNPAAKFFGFASDWLFTNWREYNFPLLMAALADVFPSSNFGTPVLEGQVRLKSDGTGWCKIYGLKIDEVNSNGNNH